MTAPVSDFKEAYPEWFGAPITPAHIAIWLLIFIAPFLIPYLYVRFFERRFHSLITDILSPFIRSRLHLEKPLMILKQILEFRIFRFLKNGS